MQLEYTVLLTAWVAIILLALALSGVIRQLRVIEAKLGELSATHGQASRRSVLALDGHLDPARVTCLYFVDRGCPSCERLLKALPAVAAVHADELSFVVAAMRGGIEVQGDLLRPATDGGSLAQAFGVPATPYGVAVTPRGVVVASAPLGSEEALERFIARAREGVVEHDAAPR